MKTHDDDKYTPPEIEIDDSHSATPEILDTCMRYLIYELWENGKDHPFYVGWTDTAIKGTKRPKEHVNEALRNTTSGNQLKLNVIRKILRSGNQIDILHVAHSDNFTKSLLIEKDLIAKWGRRDTGFGPLTNLTDGGEGTTGRKDSLETRNKKAAGRMGKKHSPAAIEKIKQARAKQSPTIWSDESRRKLSQNSHFRSHKNKSYEELYGNDRAAIFKNDRRNELKLRRADPILEEKRILAHRHTWILKMASVYHSIFSLLDDGLRQFEIVKKLKVDVGTVRKAIKNRSEIEGVLDENL